MGTQHIELWLAWTGQTGRNSSTTGKAGAELKEIHTEMAVATGHVQKHHITACPQAWEHPHKNPHPVSTHGK